MIWVANGAIARVVVGRRVMVVARVVGSRGGQKSGRQGSCGQSLPLLRQ